MKEFIRDGVVVVLAVFVLIGIAHYVFGFNNEPQYSESYYDYGSDPPSYPDDPPSYRTDARIEAGKASADYPDYPDQADYEDYRDQADYEDPNDDFANARGPVD